MRDANSRDLCAHRVRHFGIVIAQNERVSILDKNHHPNNFLLKPSENYLVVTLSESDPGKRNPVDPHCGDSMHFVAIAH